MNNRLPVFLILILLWCANIVGAPILKKVYHYDYGPVTRLVFAFDRMPEYRYYSDSADRRISLTIPDCAIGKGVSSQSPGGPVLSRINVESTGNGLSIGIDTRQSFTLEPFTLKDGVNKIVLDIYTSKDPSSSDDILALARFYYLVHFYPKAISYYQSVAADRPDLTQIHYYWGNILKETGKSREAAEHFAKVNRNTEEYRAISNQSVASKSPTKASPTPAKVAPTPARTTPAKTAKAMETKPAPLPAKASGKPAQADKPPVKKAALKESPADKAGSKNEENTIPPADTTGTDSLATKYMDYYLHAGTYADQLFMLGRVALSSNDYASAIRYYTEAVNMLDPTSKRAAQAHEGLAVCYENLGNPDQAKLERAVAAKNNRARPIEHLAFYLIPIPLWIALTLAVGTGLVMLFLGSVGRHRKQDLLEPDFTEADVEPERIAEGYRKHYDEPTAPEQDFIPPESVQLEPIREPNPELLSEPRRESPREPEPDTRPGFDVYQPPLIAEELTPEEDAELAREEQTHRYESVNYGSFPSPENLFSGLDDTSYKTKMILKLAQDGWDADAIAKELQISRNEVDFVLKME
jgi:tetratricopeptide (TPR) repeat protein